MTAPDDQVPIRTLPIGLRFDDRPVARRIGLVVLATDHTSEIDFARVLSVSGVGVYVARIPYRNPTTPENLRLMQPRLTEGAGLILPDEPLDVVCYSCTSASVVIGDDAVEAAIRAAKPGTPVVTPPAAARLALAAFGARRISVLTPYTVETSTPMAAYFTGHGFDVAGLACFGLEDDRVMARVTPDAIVEAACAATAPDAEALFISCTALRSAEIVPEIEARIGRPVVTSNLATTWLCGRLVGETAPRPELGRLFGLPVPDGIAGAAA